MRDRLRFPASALTGLLAAFLAARIAVWWGGTTFVAYDSFSYRLDPAFDRGPLVSLTGHAPRLCAVPLFYALFPNDGARVFAQWALGTVAWAVLAWAVWTCLRSPVARIAGAAGVLLLGLLGPVTNWDFAILSESVSISLGVLVLALTLRWLATGSWRALAGLTAVALCWLFTRPEIRLLVGLLLVLVVGYAVRVRPARVAAVASAGVLLAGLVWATAITPTVGRTFAGWSATQLPLEQETLLFRLRLQVLPDPAIARVYRDRLGMPDCPGAAQVAAGSEWAIVEFADAYRACPRLRAWGERNATSSGYRFALAAPGDYARFTAGALPRAFEGTVYAHVPRLARADKLVFAPHEYEPYLLLGGFAIAIAAAAGTGAWRRRRLLVATALVVALGSLASVLGGLMYSVGEYPRFGIQEAVGVRLALVLLLVAALDAGLARRTERRAAPRADQAARAADTPAPAEA